jgi:tripartite-type tricarboxylate transporter receptor subunit TctC
MFQLLNKTNKNGTFVHYKGATAFIPDLVENRLQTSCLFGKDILDYVNTGKLNVIAVTSPQRLEKFPQIPTLKELNMNYAALPMWIGITSNPNADEVTINQIKNSLRKMVNDKTIVEEFSRDVDITIRPEKFDTLKTRITEDFPYYLNMINH